MARRRNNRNCWPRSFAADLNLWQRQYQPPDHVPEPIGQELNELKAEMDKKYGMRMPFTDTEWIRLWKERYHVVEAREEQERADRRLGLDGERIRATVTQQGEEAEAWVSASGVRFTREGERLRWGHEAVEEGAEDYELDVGGSGKDERGMENTEGSCKEGILLDLGDAAEEPVRRDSGVELWQDIFGESEMVKEKKDPFEILLDGMKKL